MPTLSYRRLRDDRSGAVAVEYALLGAFVALGIVSALVSTKVKLNDLLGLINIRFAVVQQQMANDTRIPVSTVYGSYRSNNIDFTTVSVSYSDGSRVVTTTPVQQGLTFLQSVQNYNRSGVLTEAHYDYQGGVWGNDIYTYRADGSFDITNTTSSGDTFVYNARNYDQDGYEIYARHMLSASRPLYLDAIQVTDKSNPSNPILVGEIIRNADGSISSSGKIDASKYLP